MPRIDLIKPIIAFISADLISLLSFIMNFKAVSIGFPGTEQSWFYVALARLLNHMLSDRGLVTDVYRWIKTWE